MMTTKRGLFCGKSNVSLDTHSQPGAGWQVLTHIMTKNFDAVPPTGPASSRQLNNPQQRIRSTTKATCNEELFAVAGAFPGKQQQPEQKPVELGSVFQSAPHSLTRRSVSLESGVP
jgi:hypothetical protein